ncbi:PepSY domain-containing protein, partial [Ralstonia pseudosolanacearum]
RGAAELLCVAASLALLAPVTNAIVTGDHLLRTVLNGQWNLAGFDLGALALAFGFVALARVTWRRARHGAQASVWALPPQTARQSCEQGRDTVGQA